MPADNAQEAHDKLVREVFAPVFFTKLANDYGVVPQDADEERELLYLAETLPAAKQATAGRSAISDAANGLRKMMGQTPAAKQAAQQTQTDQIQKYAAEVCQNNEGVRVAALTLAQTLAAS